jgi:hypothetical protein
MEKAPGEDTGTGWLLFLQYPCGGFSENMNGTLGERGIRTQRFIEKLEGFIPGIEINPWDERLSTVQSRNALIEMGIGSKRHKEKIDQLLHLHSSKLYGRTQN